MAGSRGSHAGVPDGKTIHPAGSAKETGLGDITKDFWNMHIIAAFREPFFIITQEACGSIC